MAKTISFNFDNKDYTLEFNRKSVQKLEEVGLKPQDFSDKPVSTTWMLFKGAFYMHHSSTPEKIIEAIYEELDEKSGLLEKLAEMYGDTVQSLVGNTSKGNLKWGANW